jgi:hypothetical protein
MKKISGIQEILLSVFLLLDLWEKDSLLDKSIFWHSLRSNVDSYFDPNLRITITMLPSLDKQDELYADSFYIKKDLLSDKNVEYMEGTVYRLINSAKYKMREVVICERENKLYCFDKKVFLSLFERING